MLIGRDGHDRLWTSAKPRKKTQSIQTRCEMKTESDVNCVMCSYRLSRRKNRIVWSASAALASAVELLKGSAYLAISPLRLHNPRSQSPHYLPRGAPSGHPAGYEDRFDDLPPIGRSSCYGFLSCLSTSSLMNAMKGSIVPPGSIIVKTSSGLIPFLLWRSITFPPASVSGTR